MKRIIFLFLPFLPYLASAQVAKDTVTVLTLAQIPAGAIRDTTNFTFVQDNGFKKATFDSLAKYTRVKLQTYTLDSTHITASGLNLQGTRFTGVLPVTRGGTGNTTGLAATATALATTRTIWGQNFNGTANVTGNLSGVGNITGTLRSGVTYKNVYVSPIYAAMAGEGFADYGMIGVLYDRNELTNSAFTGGITINISGGGTYTNTVNEKNKIVNASGDFLSISGLTDSSVVTITVDLKRFVDNYSDARWQPFFQTRLNPSTSFTFPDSIAVEVSGDNVTYSTAASGAWAISDFLTNTNSVQNGLWSGLISGVSGATSFQYVKFTIKNFRIGTPTNTFYLSEIGVRHQSAPAARQYLNQVGENNIYNSPTLRLLSPTAGADALYGKIAFATTDGDNAYINVGTEIRGYSSGGANQSNLRFYTAGGLAGLAEKMRITAEGETWIGYTTDQGNYRLQVADSVYVGGNVSAAAYTTRSDYELKENIQDVGYGIQEVMQLQPVKYMYKSNGSTQLGFIAQDLGVVLPEVVSFEDNMAVFYNSIIPVLTKAIQEQQAQIEQLKQRITQLENK